MNNFIFHTISPIHVGTGEEIDRAELAFDKKFVYRSYLSTLYKKVNYSLIDPLITEAMENPTQEHKNLQELVIKHADYKISASNDVEITKIYRESIKTNGQYYIPGSSIKGAILTALVNNALIELSQEDNSYKNFFERIINKTIKVRPMKISQLLIEITLTYLNLGLEEFSKKIQNLDYFLNKRNYRHDRQYPKIDYLFNKWIQISDTQGINVRSNGFVRRYKRYGLNTEGPEDINLETIHYKNQVLPFKIKMTNNNLKFSLDEILHITDQHYEKLLKMEYEWISRNELPKRIQRKKDITGSLIRLGFGSGHSSLSIYPAICEIFDESLVNEYGRKWEFTKDFYPEPRSKWLAKIKLERKSGDIIEPYCLPLGWAIISKS